MVVTVVIMDSAKMAVMILRDVADIVAHFIIIIL